jgi:hypothetical protein
LSQAPRPRRSPAGPKGFAQKGGIMKNAEKTIVSELERRANYLKDSTILVHEAKVARTVYQDLLRWIRERSEEEGGPALDGPGDLDTGELVDGLEASGLQVFTIDENTDFSKLPSLGEMLGRKE